MVLWARLGAELTAAAFLLRLRSLALCRPPSPDPQVRSARSPDPWWGNRLPHTLGVVLPPGDTGPHQGRLRLSRSSRWVLPTPGGGGWGCGSAARTPPREQRAPCPCGGDPSPVGMSAPPPLTASAPPAGTPVNRIPIMAKQVLDLFMLYVLVTEKGGLVEVINKKLWREITKGLNLPTSITSAAFTLRTQ